MEVRSMTSLSKIQKIRVIWGRSENMFNLLQWWSMRNRYFQACGKMSSRFFSCLQICSLIDTHCKRLNVFSDHLKITRIF